MSGIGQLNESLAIVERFYWHLDEGQFAQMDALMTRDGLYYGPDDKPVSAGSGLVADMTRRLDVRRSTMAHVLSNLFVDPDSIDSASVELTVRGFMTVYVHDAGLKPAGGEAGTREGPAPLSAPRNIWALDIRLRHGSDGWLISRVRNSMRFKAPA